MTQKANAICIILPIYNKPITGKSLFEKNLTTKMCHYTKLFKRGGEKKKAFLHIAYQFTAILVFIMLLLHMYFTEVTKTKFKKK